MRDCATILKTKAPMKKKLIRYTGMAAAALMIALPFRLEAAGESAARPLTLEETIRLAREHSPSLKAAAEDVNAADARIALYLRPRTARLAQPGERRDGRLLAQYWVEGGTAFALVGPATEAALRRLAPLLRGSA